MAKIAADALLDKALKKHKPDQALAFLSRSYEMNGDPAYLQACASLLPQFADDVGFFNSALQAMLRVMFERPGEATADAFRKIRTRKLAPALIRCADQTAARLRLPTVAAKDGPVERVLVLTAQFLRLPHSPSLVALAMAQRVMIGGAQSAVFDSLMFPLQPSSTFHPQFKPNVYTSEDGAKCQDFTMAFKGCDIPVMFAPETGMSLDKLQASVDRIADFAPDAVVSIGDSNLLAEICAKVWPTALWPTVQNEQLSAAPLQFHQTAAPPAVQIDWKKLRRPAPSQVKHDFSLDLIMEKSAEMTREDLKIAKEDFVFAVVGARIDLEVTAEFQSVLVNVLKADPRARILIVGAKNFRVSAELAAMRERITVIGYTFQLREILALADAFLNPPRQGGGQSAYIAIMERLPILTLKNCDVELSIREGGAVDTLDELEALAIGAMTDEALREDYIERSQRQLRKAREVNPPEASAQRLLAHLESLRESFHASDAAAA